MTVEELAHHLWEQGEHRPHSPAWEQLGDVTKSVWYDRARELLAGDLA